MVFPCAMGLWSWWRLPSEPIPMAHAVMGYAVSPDALTMTTSVSRKCGAMECFKQWNLRCSDGSLVAPPYIHRVAVLWHSDKRRHCKQRRNRPCLAGGFLLECGMRGRETCKSRLENHVYVVLSLPIREARLAPRAPYGSVRQSLHTFLYKPLYPLVDLPTAHAHLRGNVGDRHPVR